MTKSPATVLNDRGFTLVELAVVMVVVGLLTWSGIGLLAPLIVSQQRAETVEIMERVRHALLVQADADGILLAEDDSGSYDQIPYVDLGIGTNDAWNRPLKYEVHDDMLAAGTACSTLADVISGTYDLTGWRPMVWDDAGGAAIPVAVVLVSGGARDADDDGNVFDNLPEGDNISGDPYLRRRPVSDFDDLVSYIGAATLYDWMGCQ